SRPCWRGPRTWAPSTSTRGPCAGPTSTTRTNCASTSTRSPAPPSPTRSASPPSCASRSPARAFTHAPRACIALAREVERRMPDHATTSWWKEERGERIFLDYNQAARDRTIASAWSVRGTPRATVSVPVTWDPLSTVEPDDLDVFTVPAWLAEHGDPLVSLDST